MKKIIKKIIPKKFLNFRHLFFAWYGAFKYKYPSEELLVIGITGTSGKSTTTYLLRQLLESAGLKVGSLSTIDFYVAGEEKLNNQKMTMLGRMQIQKYLRKMVDKKCDVAIIETTSEGRLQYRHSFINYDIMMLTNLYTEHIESHGSFDAYKQAKLDVFEYVANQKTKIINHKSIDKTAIVNCNNEYSPEFLNFNFSKKIVFGSKDEKNYLEKVMDKFLFSNTSIDKDGLHFEIENHKFVAPMYGEHNIYNIVGAITIARELNIDWGIIEKAVGKFKNVPGRNEFIFEAKAKGFEVIVDYAFEPIALSKLYEVVDLFNPTGRIIHVCGSTGGGRDKSRRTVIGELVGKKADIFLVTDEDPYEEDPLSIIKEVSISAQKVGKKLNENLFEILDRKEAIGKAIEMAKAGDLILITGKGSEQGMCVAGEKMIHWDDRQFAREFIQKII
ncbi:MAG: UDP-N-acetylmuramyl-tripeptide synthetase [Candidatus Magasanikbacteria bacterium]